MSSWMTAFGQVSLAAALATFALVLLLGVVPKTRLTFLLAGSALVASLVVFFHYFVFKVQGWPALTTGIFVWINAMATFKHRLALERSITRSFESRKFGRRYDD